MSPECVFSRISVVDTRPIDCVKLRLVAFYCVLLRLMTHYTYYSFTSLECQCFYVRLCVFYIFSLKNAKKGVRPIGIPCIIKENHTCRTHPEEVSYVNTR